MNASWGDFDNDGNLDVYVTNYMTCTGEWATEEEIISQVSYYPDTLYRNNGDGTFSDATSYLENDPDTRDDGSTIGAGFGAAWFDYDGDGRLDLYLANDFVGPSPDNNRLWHNDGPVDGGPADGDQIDREWRFTDVSVASGTSFFMNTMGIGVGDFDRDLDLDLGTVEHRCQQARSQRRRRSVHRRSDHQHRPPVAGRDLLIDHVGDELPRPEPRWMGGPLHRGRESLRPQPRRDRSAAQRALRVRQRRASGTSTSARRRAPTTKATPRASPSPTTTGMATWTCSSSTRVVSRTSTATSRRPTVSTGSRSTPSARRRIATGAGRASSSSSTTAA